MGSDVWHAVSNAMRNVLPAYLRYTARAIGFAMATGMVLGACSEETTLTYQGYVEGEFVHIASPLAGRLEQLPVQRGQSVEARALLYTLEADQEKAAKRQSEEQLNASSAQLADVSTGQRNPEREVISAQLAQAKAAERKSASQLTRDQTQFEIGGISQSQVEDARARHEIDAARVRELASRLEVSRLPARDDQIRMQSAQVAAARAALEQAEWRLAQKRIEAMQAGVVVDTLYRVGEWVPASSPVVRMLPPGNIKIRFFVPEPIAGELKLGQNVTVRCSGCEADLTATVSYISIEPEYTPPIIYSNETRAKFVFMIEARPPIGSAPRLHPGLPVAVVLR